MRPSGMLRGASLSACSKGSFMSRDIALTRPVQRSVRTGPGFTAHRLMPYLPYWLASALVRFWPAALHAPGPISQYDSFRSEEHTSELQSHHDIVCRLLLEKEKSKEEIDEGIKKAQLAYEIATNSLFKDVSGYSFPNYERELKTHVDLEALKEFTERFLQHE